MVMAGYHSIEITKGVIGELSKVREELNEAYDADAQNNPIMVILELSDMIGAIRCYLEKHHPTLKLNDLVTMADATNRAFQSGYRK